VLGIGENILLSLHPLSEGGRYKNDKSAGKTSVFIVDNCSWKVESSDRKKNKKYLLEIVCNSKMIVTFANPKQTELKTKGVEGIKIW